MFLCDETITLYNARYDAENDLDVYERTQINGVHWYCETVSTVETSGLRAANRVTVRIPEEADFGGKGHVDRVAYTESNPETTFTLKAGDIIVRGVATEVHPLPKDLQHKYAECITVLGVTDMTVAPNAPHWKVVGT